MPQTTYQETLDYMFSKLPMFSRIGADAFKKDLTNIINLCAILENPQLTFPTIHIGGTNGKGSTTNYLASILIESGLKVGIYTSPHLVDFRERIKIGNQYIEPEFIIEFIEDLKSKIEELQPSFFEISVAMAFQYFKKMNVDIAIIEVGLGGRLDSTNIISPILSIITNISFDHMNMLGNTIAEIAQEKAGIIKKNTPIIIGESNDTYNQIFIQKAILENAPIIFSDKKAKISSNYDKRLELEIDSLKIDLQPYAPLPSYQFKNIKTVVCAYLEYCKITSQIPNINDIENGLKNISKNTLFSGRWTRLNLSTKVILECAHNLAGIEELHHSLKHENYNRLFIIFGAVRDKDLNKIIENLPKKVECYILTQADIPRAMPVNELKNLFLNHGYKDLLINDSPINSLSQALKLSTKNDLILVTGSIFLVGEILRDIDKI